MRKKEEKHQKSDPALSQISELSRYADIKLVVTPREPTTLHRNLRISARIAMLGLVDIIALGLFNSLDDASLVKMESILHLYSRGDERPTNPAREAGHNHASQEKAQELLHRQSTIQD